MRRPAPGKASPHDPRAVTADPFLPYSASFRSVLRGIREEAFSFWMMCGYLIVEYVRPQSIFPALDVLPWGKIFLILAMLGLLTQRRFRLVSDPANVLMTIFLAVILMASYLAIYPDVSWFHWFDFVGWYLIYFLIVNIVTTERRFTIFLAIFLLASFKLSFFGARTWALRGFSFTTWGLMGPSGPFQNSGELSVQMLMFGPIAYEYAQYLRVRAPGAPYAFMLFLPITAAMTVIGASSRGGQVGLAYQMYRSLLKGRLRFRTLVATAMVVSLAVALIPNEQVQRFQSAGTDTTSQQRLLYWKRGVEMIDAHPTLGVGFYNFAPFFAQHYPEDILLGSAQLPHNIFIQVGTDAGLLGLAAFIALIARNFLCCRQITRIASESKEDLRFAAFIARGLGIALWGFLIAGQFVTIAYYPFFWVNLAMSVALLNIVRSRSKIEQRPVARRA